MSRNRLRVFRELLLGQGFEPRMQRPEAWLVGTLASVLPEELLADAVVAAQRASDPRERTFILLALARCMAGSQREATADAAFAAASEVDDPPLLAELLSQALEMARELRPDLGRRAIDLLQRANPRTDPRFTYPRLAAFLNEEQLWLLLRDVFAGLRPAWVEAQGISPLVPWLSPAQISYVLERGLAIDNPVAGGYVISAVLPHLAEEQHSFLLESVAEADIETVGGIFGMGGFYPVRIEPPKSLVSAALDRLAELEPDWQWPNALVSIAAHADGIQLNRILALVEQVEEADFSRAGQVRNACARRRFELEPSPESLVALTDLHSQQAMRLRDLSIEELESLLLESSAALPPQAQVWIPVILAMKAGSPEAVDRALEAISKAVDQAVDQIDQVYVDFDRQVPDWLEKLEPNLDLATSGKALAVARRLTSSDAQTAAMVCALGLLRNDPTDLGVSIDEVVGHIRNHSLNPAAEASALTELARRLPSDGRRNLVAEIMMLATMVPRPSRLTLLEELWAVLDPPDRQANLPQLVKLALPSAPFLADPLKEFTKSVLDDVGWGQQQVFWRLLLESAASQAGAVEPADLLHVARPRMSTVQAVTRWTPAGSDEAVTPANQVRIVEPAPQDLSWPVRSGFARLDSPRAALSMAARFELGEPLYFWLTFEEAHGALPGSPDLPADLPADQELAISVWGFPNEISIADANRTGRVSLGANGRLTVVSQPADVAHEQRLLFPVELPNTAGRARLRCNIYWEQVLVQSQVVEVWVGAGETHPARVYTDYAIESALDIRDIQAIGGHDTSILVAGTGRGEHMIMVNSVGDGAERVLESASISAARLGSASDAARRALRRVAWGSSEEWTGQDFRYEEGQPQEGLAVDLHRLAVAGYNLYLSVFREFTKQKQLDLYPSLDRASAALRASSHIQIALPDDANTVVPSALFYDYPIDSNAATLCPDFRRAMDRQGPGIGRTDCFAGECAQARNLEKSVVCPGGFWGFRHALGMPLSRTPAGLRSRDAAPPRLDIAIYRPFDQARAHCKTLLAVREDAQVSIADNRDDVLQRLAGGAPDMVYFYCHGGLQLDRTPYLRVGETRESSGLITPSDLIASRVRWNTVRPLVFLNGCRTSAIGPAVMLDFVSFFVEDARAAGVIGTEITVFETTARLFAETCIRAYVHERKTIGEAVREGRIALLGRGNPLGLIYTNFALSTARLLA